MHSKMQRKNNPAPAIGQVWKHASVPGFYAEVVAVPRAMSATNRGTRWVESVTYRQVTIEGPKVTRMDYLSRPATSFTAEFAHTDLPRSLRRNALDPDRWSLDVGWDLDAVGYDFYGALAAYSRTRGYPTADGAIWAPYRGGYAAWGMDDDGFEAMCKAAADDGMLWNGGFAPEFVKAMQATAAAGHRNVVVTARDYGATPSVSHTATLAALTAAGIPAHSITFSHDKTVVPTDTFIEDHPGNYDALSATGCRPVLWAIPQTDTLRGDRRSVSAFSDYVEYVEDIASTLP